MPRNAKRLLLNFAIGAGVGAVGGIAIARFGLDAHVPPLAGEDVAALLIAAMLVFAGLFTGWVSARPERFKRVAEKRDDVDPVDPIALQVSRRSAVVMLLAGIMFAIPPLVAASDAGQAVRIAAACGVFALLAFETLINWRLWRDGDELTRSVIVSTGAICFWGAQFALFVWAALAKLALIPDIGSWTMITALMAVYLVASGVVGVRRGFAQL